MNWCGRCLCADANRETERDRRAALERRQGEIHAAAAPADVNGTYSLHVCGVYSYVLRVHACISGACAGVSVRNTTVARCTPLLSCLTAHPPFCPGDGGSLGAHYQHLCVYLVVICCVCAVCAVLLSLYVCCAISLSVVCTVVGLWSANRCRDREGARARQGESAVTESASDPSVAKRPRTPLVHWKPVLRAQGGRHPQHVCPLRRDQVHRPLTGARVRCCVGLLQT